MRDQYRAHGLEVQYEPRLKITETFLSLQGEGSHSGLPCYFIRLTGCPLRCVYCDSDYAFQGGEWRSFSAIIDDLKQSGCKLVQVTGGEPLAQKAVFPFIHQLCEDGFRVLLETSGAISLTGLHPDCHIVMDIKTPGSHEQDRNTWNNLDLLKSSDEVKLVLTSMEDWDWALAVIKENKLDRRFKVLISTIPEPEELKQLVAEALIESGINARFQLQLHKIIWGEVPGK